MVWVRSVVCGGAVWVRVMREEGDWLLVVGWGGVEEVAVKEECPVESGERPRHGCFHSAAACVGASLTWSSRLSQPYLGKLLEASAQNCSGGPKKKHETNTSFA